MQMSPAATSAVAAYDDHTPAPTGFAGFNQLLDMAIGTTFAWWNYDQIVRGAHQATASAQALK
jgi:hypothetical protein